MLRASRVLSNLTHHAAVVVAPDPDAQRLSQIEFVPLRDRNKTAAFTAARIAANVIGRGLIVHRDPDDYKTQPTGNSGPRMACAVISKG